LIHGAKHTVIPAPEESIVATATKSTSFVYGSFPRVEVGADRYVVTKKVGGSIVETASYVQAPVNSSGQKCAEGWLGSWTEGATTTDRYSHGLLRVLSIEPKYDWNHALDRPESTPFGHEISWG
jgi:hypothetical protein